MQFIKLKMSRTAFIKIAAVCIVFILLLWTHAMRGLESDFAWAYVFSHYLRRGFVPYRDYTMMVPPFAAWIFSLPLYINDSIYMYATLFAGSVLLIFFLNEKILSFFDIPKPLSLFISIYSAGMFAGTNLSYNTVVHILMLLMIYVLLRGNLKLRSYALLGMLSSFTVLTKQSSGLYITSICMICMLALSKQKIQAFITFGIAGILSAVPFFLYLYLNGAILDALDTWFGVTGFNTYSSLISSLRCCAFASLPAMAIVLFNTRNSADRDKYLLLCAFSFCSLLHLYPLPNYAHIMASFAVLLLPSGCFIARSLAKDNIRALYSTKTLLVAAPYLLTYMIMISNVSVPNNMTVRDTKYPFIYDRFGLAMVNQYMYSDPDHKYLFIDENSTGAHILHDLDNDNKTVTFYKYFDLLFEGNIGSKNAKELAENADCDYFIIREDSNWFFWQYSDELKNYLYSLPVKDTISIDDNHKYIVVSHH